MSLLSHTISSVPFSVAVNVKVAPSSTSTVVLSKLSDVAVVTFFTVTSHVAVFPLQLAVTVVVPAATAFIVAVVPFPVTVTILDALVVHVILPSRFIKFAVIVASSAVPSTICNVFFVSVNAIPSTA